MKKVVYILSAISVVCVVACSAIAAKDKKENNESVVFDLSNKLIDNVHYNKQSLNDKF